MYQVFVEKRAGANSSSAMERRDHFKNPASPKSHMSRRNFFIAVALMFLATIMVAPAYAQFIIVPEGAAPPRKANQIPHYEFLLEFESNLKERGFTKQVALWDLFLPTGLRSRESYIKAGDYAQVTRTLVGIWVNYQDKLVVFRTEGSVLSGNQSVSFDQIVEARVKVDAYQETTVQKSNNPSVMGNNASVKTITQEIVKSAEITIVTRSPNGIQNYRIHVSDSYGMSPFLGVHNSKNDWAVSFVQNIADEINFIIDENKKENRNRCLKRTINCQTICE